MTKNRFILQILIYAISFGLIPGSINSMNASNNFESTTYYVSSSDGNDGNDGESISTPFKSISKINTISLHPGDKVLFKRNEIFLGQFEVRSENGTLEDPISISSYGEGEYPIIDGNGHLSSIHILNSSSIHLSYIEIKNDNPISQQGTPTNLRYGVYIENNHNDGTTFSNYRIQHITFNSIYTTDDISDNDQTGINTYAIRTSGSWGEEVHKIKFEDVLVENCYFTRTGRHGVLFTAVNGLRIKNNLFEHVGGAGMVIGNNSTNILVEHNVTNYTGSNIDPRMAARGSGLWAFRTKNLIVQHNKFMHARGSKDSHGMHVDIGNRNLVYQYNYSEDNEGGFVEILGANVNVGYRYNVSIGDGWRSRGPQLGRIFWIGAWSGNAANPIGSDSVFIYNNSIYVRDSIAPRIWIAEQTKRCKIFNNIVYAADRFSDIHIKNDSNLNDFNYNIWYGDIPAIDNDGDSYRGDNAIMSDPLYSDEIVTDIGGFILQANSPGIKAGKLIFNENVNHPFDYYSNHGGRDFFGHAVSDSEPSNIGAFNGGIISNTIDFAEEAMLVYPNPALSGSLLNLKLPEGLTKSEFLIQIIDSTGRIHFEQTFNQEISTMRLNNLQSGHYQIVLSSTNKRLSRSLLIFQ